MTKWFGDPWPSADRRAPVCQNDADRVPVPVGSMCVKCSTTIWQKDRGVIIPHLRSDQTTGKSAFHIRCFLADVVGWSEADAIMEEVDRGE